MRQLPAILAAAGIVCGVVSCANSDASPAGAPTTTSESRPTATDPEHTTETTSAPTSVEPGTSATSDEFFMNGHSMDSAILDGERMQLDRSAYAGAAPRRGDVIVYSATNSSGQPITLVKRVVGVGGEALEYRSCVLHIDGAATAEPWLDAAAVSLDSCGPDQTSVTIPDGKVFVLGDNRASSIDSREFGPVDNTAVLGRVVRVTGVDGVERAIEIP